MALDGYRGHLRTRKGTTVLAMRGILEPNRPARCTSGSPSSIRRKKGGRSLCGLGHAEQSGPVQFVHREMVKGVAVAFDKAVNDDSVVAVVFTGAGDKAFCTGGNVTEYTEYYARRP